VCELCTHGSALLYKRVSIKTKKKKKALGGGTGVGVEEVSAMALAYVRRQEEVMPGEGGEGPDPGPVQ
jgi:glucokinase